MRLQQHLPDIAAFCSVHDTYASYVCSKACATLTDPHAVSPRQWDRTVSWHGRFKHNALLQPGHALCCLPQGICMMGRRRSCAVEMQMGGWMREVSMDQADVWAGRTPQMEQ